MDFDQAHDAICYIHSLGRFSGTAGLHRMRALCAALGNPQDKLRFVHIAGTNGKGSTATMLGEILRCSGLRVGLYTSPYLLHFIERIRVNGHPISDVDLTRLTAHVRQAVGTLDLPAGESIGEFEFVTALAFLYFVEQGCDIIVLETGLGGRCDATNVITTTEVCVFTPLSLDHTAVLGSSLSAIAAEKAAIIKPDAAVVMAPGQPDEMVLAVHQQCRHMGAVLYANAHALKLLRTDIDGSAFLYGEQGYTIAMPGRHQLQNVQTALATVEALRARGWAISVEDTVRGLARARMAGRLECLRTQPLVLLDGAHNEAGAQILCDFIDEMLKMRRILLVVGMMRDKAYEKCIALLAAHADVFYACAPESDGRALPAQTAAALAEQHCAEVYDCGSVYEALRRALAAARPNDCILLCGSLFLLGEAKKILSSKQKMTI